MNCLQKETIKLIKKKKNVFLDLYILMSKQVIQVIVEQYHNIDDELHLIYHR
jgi:hypothetical protein